MKCRPPESVDEPLRDELLEVCCHKAPSDGEEHCHEQEQDPNKVYIVVSENHPARMITLILSFPAHCKKYHLYFVLQRN